MSRYTPVCLRCLVAATTLFLAGSAASAQSSSQPASGAPPRIDLGFGVDTSSMAAREVLAVWRSYLADRPDSIRAHPLWSAADRERWSEVDLTAPWLYQNREMLQRFRVTVVQLGPASEGDSTYLLRALFARVDTASGAVLPLALARVYAVPEGGRWRLANALPRLTADWSRERVGSILFVHPPGYQFSRTRAGRAARFADSLATAFRLPPVEDLEVYVADDPEVLWRAVGLDFALYPGGRSYAANRLLFSASSAYREFYPHELAHVVLQPVAQNAPWILHEGLATWTGGSRGRDFVTLVRELESELRAKPWVTLDTILAPHDFAIDSVSYTTGAVLLAMAHEHGGLGAVRTLLQSSHAPDEIRRATARVLGLPPDRVNAEWRRAVERLAGGPRDQ